MKSQDNHSNPIKLQHNHTQMMIVDIREECTGIRTFELDGEIDANAGNFGMVYIPGTSENPLTISYDKPLRFMAKAVGPPDSFTNTLFRMRRGDKVQITGPLGNSFFDLIDLSRPVYAVVGGCGAADLPLLGRTLNDLGNSPSYIIGAKNVNQIPDSVYSLDGENFIISTDDGSFGVKGTVLDAVREAVLGPLDQAIVCGKREMIIDTSKRLLDYLRPEDIIISLDPYMKCGRGVCGSCEVDGYHVCTDGPNFRLSDGFLDAPDWVDYRRGKSGALEKTR